MKEEVIAYQKCGKVEAAHRLRDQVNLIEERFAVCQEKLAIFTSPQANFESRLNRALGELRSIERSSCILDVASAGPGHVQDQYKHCLKMYRTLSEIKSEIENVIKTGRKVCDDKTTKNPKKLNLSIDTLKHLYNSLGEHVTQSKVNLEKLLRWAAALQQNIIAIEKWLNFCNKHAEATIDERKLAANGDAVLLMSIEKCAQLLEKCTELYANYSELCEATYLEDLHNKIEDLSTRFIRATGQEAGKNLLEIKSTLQNLDNVSMDTLR